MKMAKFGTARKWGVLLLLCLGITMQLLPMPVDCASRIPITRRKALNVDDHQVMRSSLAVSLREERKNNQVVMDNGIVRVTLMVPSGDVLGVQYKGIQNVLGDKEAGDRGYLDVVWSFPEKESRYNRIRGTNFTVITQNDDHVELSFLDTYDNSSKGSDKLPITVDRRYMMRRGSSGFYMYSVFTRLEGWPGIHIGQVRNVFKLREETFDFMAITDTMQRFMPRGEDRDQKHSVRLAYPEAVLLTNPTNPLLRGQVDDKYQYSIENQYNTVQGWISTNSDPSVGFWMITPSNEFRNAGPVKQDLTSHCGPVHLNMYMSSHYAGKDMKLIFEDGEPWKIVYGPVFVYLNSGSRKDDRSSVWEDAKSQRAIETQSWPYDFAESKDFMSSDQRGTVSGKLLVRQSHVDRKHIWACYAYVGLARPGEVGSWQIESKGYQFWTRADKRGQFVIENVVPGEYNLFAWVPGFIGDYKHVVNITIKPGSKIDLGLLIFRPPRNGPTLWEIGIPDRTAAEFYVPDPYPTLMNQLYTSRREDNFRQYGIWERYSDLYPNKDLVYTVGASDYRNDWFYAHVTRHVGNRTYKPTTWQILFDHEKRNQQGNYTLHVALASATGANVQVRFNHENAERPHFSTGTIGGDNAIARHGIHGLYRLYSFDVPNKLIVNGNNTVYMRQAKGTGPFEGVMYDYLRLEGPSQD